MFIKEGKFWDLLKQGRISPDDYEDFSEYFYTKSRKDETLFEFLGMTWPQFSDFVRYGHPYLRKFYGIERGRKVAGKEEK